MLILSSFLFCASFFTQKNSFKEKMLSLQILPSSFTLPVAKIYLFTILYLFLNELLLKYI